MVKTLTRATLVALVAYMAVSMARSGRLDSLFVLSAGPIQVYLGDLLLLAVVLLLLREFVLKDGRRLPTANRRVVFLVFAYCAYQIAVVLPVSVIFHDLEPIAVTRQIEGRLGLILIPFVYLVVLRCVSPRAVVALVNVAAGLLALYAIYSYATVGPLYDSGTRLRELWGGASLLFGFLVLTSLFLARPSLVAYAAAVLGLVGVALTNHRSAYLALLAVGVPLFFHFRRASSRTVVVLFVAVSAAALLVTASPTIRESAYYSLRTMVNPDADNNSRDRVDRSRLGWEYFVAYPLGDYTWNQRYYLVDLAYPFEPHNFVVQILDEQGIVGFALFAAVIVLTVRVAWRNRAADQMSAVMLAYFVFYLGFCLFNTNILNQANVLLFGVAVALILHGNAELEGRDVLGEGTQEPPRPAR